MTLFRDLLIEKKRRRYYCELEYLESSGTQYIDTGITGTTTTMGVDVEWMFSDDSANMCIFSSRSGQTSNTFTLFWLKTSQNRMRFDANGQKYFANGVNTVPNQLMRFTYKSASGAVATLYNLTNGISQTETVGQIPTVSSNNLYLFQSRDKGSVTSSIKMYYFKLYDGDTLLRDMIPVLDWNYVPCMYDKVTGQLFYNAGTGSFTYGREIHYVDYLESNGAPYIDTGLQPTDDWGYRIRNTYTVGSGEQCAIGCMDSGNRFVGVYTSGSENAISGGWGSFVGFLPNYTWTTGTILDVKCNYKNNRKIIIGETEVKDITDIHISGTIRNTLCLFGRNAGSITKMIGKVYGAEITNGQNTVADFYPAIDENGVGFMFDKVTHTCFLNSGSGAFKYPARQLVYLKSTGTEYIDTGTKFDCANTTIEVKTNETSLTQVHSICGNDGNVFYLFRGTGNWAVGYNATAFNIQDYVVLGDNTFKIDKNLVYVNGSLVKTYTASSTVSTSNTLIFNRKTSLVDSGPVTIYYCKISENNVLVRDYIPAFKDGVAGFLNKVDGTFFTNSGTGQFLTGKIIESRYE